MLTAPDVSIVKIAAKLEAEYGLRLAQVEFLPLGADLNTAVYRVETGQRQYFLKLRAGSFDTICIDVPVFLKSQGVINIITPLETLQHQYWTILADYKVILYPYIFGADGYTKALTGAQWLEFGASLDQIHSVNLPAELKERIPREDFSPRWREQVRRFQSHIRQHGFEDPIASKLAGFMLGKSHEVDALLEMADQLGDELDSLPPEFVLCHSDIHPGNLLITPGGDFFLVDWDQPVLAPRERDLSLVGGSPLWNAPGIISFFYNGYGMTGINRAALTYYRCERIIQDLAVECEQVFSGAGGSEDRAQALEYFKSNFLPGHELELALSE